MPQPVDAIYTLAADVLTAVVTRWDVDAEALPDKQYVSNGFVVWDCEQVAVEVERTYGTDGSLANQIIDSLPPGGTWAMRGVTVAVWIVRCVHDIDSVGETVILPSAAEMEADAQILLADPTAILNALVAAYKAGELGTCQGVAFEEWSAQGPEGGFGGGVCRVRLSLV